MNSLYLIISILAAAGPPLPSQSIDLSGWVSMALVNSPAIRSADASVLSAAAALTGERSFLWPSLSASAGASRNWSSSLLPDDQVMETSGSSYSMGLSLSGELLRSGGQSWIAMEASELMFQAAEADRRGAVLDVTMEVLNGYYSVLEAQELKAAAESALVRTAAQLERTESLYSIGAVTTLELLQIQVQESSDRLLVTRREQALQSAYGDLYSAAGVDGAHLRINPQAVLEPLHIDDVDGIPLDFAMNPSYQAALLRARASERRASSAARAYWPTLRAQAGWSWSDSSLDDLDRIGDNDSYSAGVSLTWNIFDGFARESSIRAARASELQSGAAVDALFNSLRASTESMARSLKTDIQYYHDSMQMLLRASEQHRLSLLSYEMGALSLLELLSAQSDLSQAEANLVSARVSALRAEASLMAGLGMMPRLGE